MPQKSELSEYEIRWDWYWIERYHFFHSRGYRLRPRFHPDHVPTKVDLRVNWRDDSRARHLRAQIMDAVQISTGKAVMLKWTSRARHPYEVQIASLFSSPELQKNPQNHCVPIFEIFPDPLDDDKDIVVMARMVVFCDAPWRTIGEVVDCFRQLFEGVQFMHENFVAHRDCALLNFVVDPSKLYPQGFHPVAHWMSPTMERGAVTIGRAKCWPSYYIIDFGLSRRYKLDDGPPLEPVRRGADQTPPEHAGSSPEPCNPFPTDIYYLGNMIREDFMKYSHAAPERFDCPSSLRFMVPLIQDMTRAEPELRPTIGEVVECFRSLCSSLTRWHLLRPPSSLNVFEHAYYSVVQAKKLITRAPALPPAALDPPIRPRFVLDDRLREFFTASRTVDSCNSSI
ncbi:unnamed protein product [Mycena citricolor]|uniref:Protein kinase domain-containing protein n=1 Tax=Mycena citricolor TaxID=2018698 RepID=A0AAD2HRB3_9AGAR|nr:unnamed protein product [Mycena citricolor]